MVIDKMKRLDRDRCGRCCPVMVSGLARRGDSRSMATRLGPGWLNRVQQLAGPTHAGRLGRYAVLAERVNALELGLERCSDLDLKSRAHGLRLRARQGDSLNS